MPVALRRVLPLVPAKRFSSSQRMPAASKVRATSGSPPMWVETISFWMLPPVLARRKRARWAASARVLLPHSLGPPMRLRDGSKFTVRSLWTR